ncbi:MAG: zf-TFIIB domain-containing protein, partial [Pseudomonadota bacterium]
RLFIILVCFKQKEENMANERISVKIRPKKGSEEAFFAEQDQQLLREFRQKTSKETTRKYCEEHKYHCFRCGAKSLAEVQRGNVKIDICINEHCGEIHLDPGELENIVKDQKSIASIRNTVLSVFKKK